MADNSGQAPAGWYPDPSGAPRQRYFDGEMWTEHYHGDVPASEPAGSLHGSTREANLSGVGTLFSHAWAALKQNLGVLIGITIGLAIAIGVLYALFFALAFSQFDDVNSFDDFGDSVAVFIIGGLVLGLVAGLLYSIYLLMTSRLLQLQHRGHNASLDAAWSKTKTRMWAFYGTAVVLYIGFYIAFFIAALILAQIAEAATILILIPLIFAWVKFGFLPIAAVATNRGESMVSASTSVSSNGRFWAVLGRMIALILPAVAVNIVGFLILLAGGRNPSGAVVAFSFLIILVGGLLATLFFISGSAKIYMDSGAPSDI